MKRIYVILILVLSLIAIGSSLKTSIAPDALAGNGGSGGIGRPWNGVAPALDEQVAGNGGMGGGIGRPWNSVTPVLDEQVAGNGGTGGGIGKPWG